METTLDLLRHRFAGSFELAGARRLTLFAREPSA
jgi:hypothetical protein